MMIASPDAQTPTRTLTFNDDKSTEFGINPAGTRYQNLGYSASFAASISRRCCSDVGEQALTHRLTMLDAAPPRSILNPAWPPVRETSLSVTP